MLQGQHDQRALTCFNNFKVYLAAKYEWNLDEDYNELFNNFFDNYFKDASETMKELFNSLTTHCAWFADEYSVYGQGGIITITERNFPKGAISNWMELIDRAFRDIESMRINLIVLAICQFFLMNFANWAQNRFGNGRVYIMSRSSSLLCPRASPTREYTCSGMLRLI